MCARADLVSLAKPTGELLAELVWRLEAEMIL
jgi:hypothetical protein